MNVECIKKILDDTKEPKGRNDCCPDQDWGLIREIRSINDFNHIERRSVNCRNDGEVRLIVVLESPHIREYDGKEGEFGPARGVSGKNLFKYLNQEALPGKYIPDDDSNLRLIVMNAVQYQCSQGVSTKRHRDNNFIRIWKKGVVNNSDVSCDGENDFMCRFNDYYEPCDYVWNCCTRGNKSKELRDLVGDAILKINNKKNYFAFHHPSSPAWSKPGSLMPYSPKIQ